MCSGCGGGVGLGDLGGGWEVEVSGVGLGWVGSDASRYHVGALAKTRRAVLFCFSVVWCLSRFLSGWGGSKACCGGWRLDGVGLGWVCGWGVVEGGGVCAGGLREGGGVGELRVSIGRRGGGMVERCRLGVLVVDGALLWDDGFVSGVDAGRLDMRWEHGVGKMPFYGVVLKPRYAVGIDESGAKIGDMIWDGTDAWGSPIEFATHLARPSLIHHWYRGVDREKGNSAARRQYFKGGVLHCKRI